MYYMENGWPSLLRRRWHAHVCFDGALFVDSFFSTLSHYTVSARAAQHTLAGDV